MISDKTDVHKQKATAITEECKAALKKITISSPLNRLPESYGGGQCFTEPLFGVAQGNDPLFDDIKEQIGSDYPTPIEIWRAEKVSDYTDSAEKLQILSMVKENPYALYSNWSERHVAFIAGLGYFGFHRSFITKKGCTVILASVITDAPLSVTKRIFKTPHNCSDKCKKCADKCPAVDALTKEGYNKEACLNYCKKIRAAIGKQPIVNVLKKRYRKFPLEGNRVEVTYPVGCTLCQFGVPCSEKDPLSVTD